ncbi:MAG: Gfo/Idh/MocA family oxidoreductase, partial [Armatimonadetes bacterium]|nr:Gfo/Idh/MocA family oxidoreductase [Armatimonadota bacterium]
ADKLAEAAKHFSLPDSTCFLGDELPWEGVEADAIIHSAPQNVRHAHAVRAFRAGKHVLSVKPMSDAWATGLDMVREAARCDRKLVIAHQMRWHPLILKLRELVSSGVLGRIGYVHMDFFYGPEGYGGTYPMPYPLLVQGSIHHFDFLRWVLDTDPRRVWASNFSPPWVTGPGMRSGYVAFEMDSGVQVCYRAVPTRAGAMSWLAEWRIEGTEGLAEVKQDRVYVNGEEILSGWEDGETFNNRRLPDLQRVVLGEFLAYVRGEPEPGISGRNNLRSLEMTHGAIRASETGSRQTLGGFSGAE